MIRSVFFMMVVRCLTLLFPFITIPLLIKVISLEGYGRYATLFAIATIFATIINYGFDYTASRDIVKNSINPKLSVLISDYFFCKLFIFIGMVILCTLIYPYFFKNYIEYLAVIIFLLAQVFMPIYVYQGLKSMGYLIYNTLAINGVFLLLIGGIFSLDYQLFAGNAFLIYALSLLFSSILMWQYAVKKFSIKFKFSHFENIKNKYLEGGAIFFSRIVSTGLSQASILILSYTLTPAALGIYSVAEKLIRALNSIFYAFQQATYPYFCEKNFTYSKYMVFLGGQLFLAIVTILAVYIFSPLLETHFFHIPNIAGLLNMISFAIIPLSISGLLGVNYFLAQNKNKKFMFSLLLGAIVNIVSIYFLSLRYSYVGAVYSLIIAESIVAIIMLIMFVFDMKNNSIKN